MVVGAFPFIKLAYMGVRQLSKPVANFMKRRAKGSNFFRTYICMPPAQMYHFYETRLKMTNLGLGKPKTVEKLNEEMAVELGAELLGEAVIFSIGAFTLFLEYNRQARKEKAHEENQNETLTELTSSVKMMTIQLETQDAKLRELERLLHDSRNKKS